MENLIPLINRLQDTFASVGMTGLDLPQIAVIGSQSSGKSSVLENIVGKDFLPRGSGIVTRRPLILQLINNSKETGQSSGEYGVFLHQPNKMYTDFHRIRDEIVAETDRVTGTNKGISALPINLKIYSPLVVNLTMIDLPGITKIAVGDQPPDIELQILDMVMEFVQQDSCLILAVTPANSDLANSDALQLAKQVDPEGHRTIGVLTKIDLMDEGTNCLDILTNKVYPLRHGFVGVVNRSQKEINQQKDVNSAIAKERHWFDQHPVYSSIKGSCGTQFLQQRLRSILIEHIQQHLPGLKSRLTSKLSDLEKELAVIDAPFASLSISMDTAVPGVGTKRLSTFMPANSYERMQAGLINIFRLFGATVKQLIDGHDGDLFNDAFNVLGLISGNHAGEKSEVVGKLNRSAYQELNGAVRIKYIFQNIFPDTLIDLESVLLSSCMDNEIRTIIYNVRGLSTGLFIPDAVFELLIKKHITKLEGPALECVDRVHDELLRLIKQLLEGPTSPVRAFPKLLQWMMSETIKILEDCKQPTVHEVKRLIMMELGYINCGHPDFVGKNGITEWFMSQRAKLEEEQRKSPNMSTALYTSMLRLTSSKNLTGGRKEGYLIKMGGTHKNFKKRFFVLKDTQVDFYEKPDDKAPKGSFSLDSCLVRDVDRNLVFPQANGVEAHRISLISEDGGHPNPKGKQFAFEIFTHKSGGMLFRNHRRLFLVAESDKEKDEWMNAFICGIQLARQQSANEQTDSGGEEEQENESTAANANNRRRRQPPSPPIRTKSAPANQNEKKPVAVTTKEPNRSLPALPAKLYATDLKDTHHGGALAPELAGDEAMQGVSSTDDTTIALVRALLHSYFVIVRKHIQDLVPKAIMLLMVTKMKKDLPVMLTNKVLCGTEDKSGSATGKRLNILDMMQESPQVQEERRVKTEMCKLVKEALHVIEHEVRKEMI